jgi:hypothetical protein
MRRFTPGLLTCSIALVTLLLSLSLRSEPLRAIAVLVTVALLSFGWIWLRPHLEHRFVLVGRIAFSMGVLGCVWSGLNVVRFYVYNSAMEGAAIYSACYRIVCTTQVMIQWCLMVFGVLLLPVLAVSAFWTRSQSAQSKT